MFTDKHITNLGGKVFHILGSCIKFLNDDSWDKMQDQVEELAIRHVEYSVAKETYALLGPVLIRTISAHCERFKIAIDSKTLEQWGDMYSQISDVMIKAAYT